MASNCSNGVPAAFFDDLVRCETRLYNAVGERLRAEHGVTTGQFEVLRFLVVFPQSRVGDIATNFAAGIGTISKGVDRLEARGLVQRLPNPADARSSLISLAPDGADLVAAAERTFDDVLADLLGSVTTDRLTAAAQALADLRRALEQARVGLPTG